MPAAIASRWFPLGVGAVTLAAAGFLLHQLLAWPPHEDETLALFVGRNPLDQLFQVVLEERGGAPLHFLLAWALTHLGFGLEGLRILSAAFAVASLPIVAALGARLAGRRQALVATVLVAASWTFLFHGVYGRMYSLFLCTSALSYLALLRALERGDRRSWALWALAILATVATHPYGAIVLATQAVFVLLARRDRLRQALVAFAAVGVLGIPFWLTDLVLAGRFDVGVGAGGERLDGPLPVFAYLWHVLGDFTTGWWPLLLPVAALGVVGVLALPRRTVLLGAAVVGVPTLAFLAARFGSATSPETRHLIFVLPFAALAVAAGIVRLGRFAPFALVALVAAQLAWAWHKTPPLFEWEPDARQTARAEASAYLAATSRPDDVLFGFEPLYLGAWERNRDVPEHGAAAGRREPGALDAARAGSAPRPRCLDPRRERAEQRRARARDRPPPAAAPGRVRRPPLRAVPRDPDERADRDARALSRAGRPGSPRRQVAPDRRCRHQPAHGRAREPRPARLRRRTLPLDELPVARRFLEGGEPRRRLAPTLPRAEPSGRGDRGGGPECDSDEERALARAA